MLDAKKPPGRPPTFSHEIAWKLIASIVAGNTISDASAEVGVSRRSVQLWRRRAWSQRHEDAPYVELEQAIQRGLLAAAEVGQPRVVRQSRGVLQPLDEPLRDLDDEFD